jgi:photosystem II stability/assembly factor-like uncharacterized protein
LNRATFTFIVLAALLSGCATTEQQSTAASAPSGHPVLQVTNTTSSWTADAHAQVDGLVVNSGNAAADKATVTITAIGAQGSIVETKVVSLAQPIPAGGSQTFTAVMGITKGSIKSDPEERGGVRYDFSVASA